MQGRRSVLWLEGARRHLNPLGSECVGVTLQESPRVHSNLTYFTNPVGDAHTWLSNGMQALSTHLRLGGSTQLKVWTYLPFLKQLSQYQSILKEHKQSSESLRIREREKQTLKAGHAEKKIHMHNKGGRVADLSAMMKITRPYGKCWDVTCLLCATGFLPLLNSPGLLFYLSYSLA